MQTMTLGAVPVDLATEDEVLRAISDAMAGQGPALVIESANLDHLHHFPTGSHERPQDGPLRWLTLMDGAPLVLTAKAMTGVSWPRLTGADMLPDLMAMAEREGRTVGFFGGMPEVHRKLAAAIETRWPAVQVAGYWAPERSDLSDPAASARLAQELADAGVDMLVVGLGKPRQEAWISSYGAATGARVLLAFGASADFIAGVTKRAPQWVQKSHLEWAFRLCQEPRRLAKRYLVQGPVALTKLVTQSAKPEPAAAPVAARD